MSERNAQDANNDCVNNNDYTKNTIQNTENVRKRKSKMQCEQIAKQQKNNYWAILDNDTNCDQECLKIFEKHVQEHEQPTTSSRAISNNTTSNENNNDKENTNNNNQFNNHFERKLRALDHKNSSNMFSEVRKQFKTNNSDINIIKIAPENEVWIRNAGINPEDLERENDSNKFIVKDDEQKLNIIGIFLEKIHSYKEIDEGNSLQVEIDNCFSRFLENKTEYEYNKSTLTTFSFHKKSNELNEDFFTSKDILIYTFKHLRKKLSSEEIIYEYCTLFNNILNNSYFPVAWRTAKVVVLPKKDKDNSDPKNLRAIKQTKQ
ncbi:probable serine/threonine-protein kinase DDB_G0282963 [Calliphora vicina]|uniref:probable serine/threonine-protein kinase DDB_G0282963 n=1 Tax=Calliphora vicina TaxID=7373 RepID=UPI00325BF50F